MIYTDKCDRCNRLYEYVKTPHDLDRMIINRALNLCPDCTREIFKIVNESEDKKDGSSTAV